MKFLEITCEFSDFLMSLAKTFRFCETPDSKDCFQLAKDNLYTYSDETGEREITDKELMLLYHDIVEITFFGKGSSYGHKYYDIGLEFPSQNGLQFYICCYDDIRPLFETLIEDCVIFTDE